mmetsp:Transcript_9883/g.21380  ORF Transcript_9883/g.21380 Transcript_9883/m.21380 type:complete len:290 (-) Transcript_9883:39-908(-)
MLMLMMLHLQQHHHHRHHHYHHHNDYCSIHVLPFSPPILTTKTLTSSITTLFSSQNKRQGWDDTNNTNKHPKSSSTSTPSSSSIGDVVQNLHGGKYQFSETQYLAGGSVVGRQFAESLYSSCDNDDDDDGNGDDEEELPRWAMRLQDPTTISAAELAAMDELKFDIEHKMHSIVIKNEERSWERYYAFLLPNNHDDNKNNRKGVVSGSSGSGDSCFRVSSSTGSLAPRGGASNVCDVTKPYSDSAIISIEWNMGIAVEGVGGDNDRKNNDWLLVVGTEAQVWRYRLLIV